MAPKERKGGIRTGRKAAKGDRRKYLLKIFLVTALNLILCFVAIIVAMIRQDSHMQFLANVLYVVVRPSVVCLSVCVCRL